ncbi:unnamed protein product [Staurois parvus]|uniref:Uncharacterized protein n=1 Tax=Staurois parvus TaxID=386267 RepID=A0ABN9D2Z2_9NEOB|nr:unnamed protein product [Staurois parvus]
MSPLQRPQPCPPANASIRLLGSVPCERRDVQRRNRREIRKCQIKSHSKTLLYQTISHTFCP